MRAMSQLQYSRTSILHGPKSQTRYFANRSCIISRSRCTKSRYSRYTFASYCREGVDAGYDGYSIGRAAMPNFISARRSLSSECKDHQTPNRGIHLALHDPIQGRGVNHLNVRKSTEARTILCGASFPRPSRVGRCVATSLAPQTGEFFEIGNGEFTLIIEMSLVCMTGAWDQPGPSYRHHCQTSQLRATP